MADLLMKMPVPYEPKRKNRFIMKFPSDLGIAEWIVSSAARPSITINEVEIPFLNTKTFALMEWVRLHAESVTGRMGYAAGYKKKVDLFMLDPTGAIVENWELRGTMLTNVNFGDLDYSGDDLADVSATLRFDRAILKY